MIYFLQEKVDSLLRLLVDIVELIVSDELIALDD